MVCFRCGNPESELVRFFNGPEVRNVYVCSQHKAETVGLPWEDTSGLSWRSPSGTTSGQFFTGMRRPHFGPPATPGGVGTMLGSPGTPNQYLNAFQNSTANVPVGESTGSEYQGVVRPGAGGGGGGLTYGDTELIAFVSGGSADGVSGIVTVLNPVNNSVIAQGLDAYQVIQAGINALTLPNKHLHIKPGIYILASSLTPLGGEVITGEGGWGQVTQLRASGNIPAMIISGQSNVQIQDLYFTHNEPVYSGGVLKFFGNCQINSVQSCSFYDLGRNTGSAIELNNGGVFVGPTFNNIVNCQIFGFRDQVLLFASGGASISGALCNGNQFIGIMANGMLNSFATFKTSTNSHLDGNIFNDVQMELVGPPGPPAQAFDYNGQASGSSFYNKHIGVFAFDLQAGAVYANLNNNTFVDFVGCQGDVRLSGGNPANLAHYSQYSDQRGFTSTSDLVAYVSGGNCTVINPVTNAIVASGTSVATTLQSGINALGVTHSLQLKPGLYQLESGLTMPQNTSLIGPPTSVSNGANLAVLGNWPAVTINAGQTCVSDVYFTHNLAAYSSTLLRVTGGINQIVVKNCTFYDNGLYSASGAAIGLDNGGGNAGPSLSTFDGINTFGFNCVYAVTLSGGTTPFINGNLFTRQTWNQPGTNGVCLRSQASTDFDDNIFSDVTVEANASPATAAIFDYSTGNNGFVFGQKHLGVIIFDMPAACVYANVAGHSVELDCLGCIGDQKFSGLTTRSRHYSLYTDDRGTTNITSSGVGTTSWFIPYTFLLSNSNAPTLVQINAANSGTASAGSPWATNINVSGFTVNTPNAVLSGVALSWMWGARL